MREIFKSGSVGGAPGNRCFYLESVILIHWNACASTLEAGAQCISSARWDLCGGCRVTGIPTVNNRKHRDQGLHS